MTDPRTYQIASLTALLAYGMAFLQFDVSLPRVLLLLALSAASLLALAGCGDKMEVRTVGQTEGSYIEPDTVHGMKYLEAIRAVFPPAHSITK